MAGLRERQKADRSRRILAAATARFRRDGFREARIEDLAGDAAVSVGTVYNYFGTKGDLLMAAVALEVEEALAEGEALVADPPRGVEAALSALIGLYYRRSLTHLSKPLWRAAMAISIEAPHTPQGLRYAALDRRLAAQVARLLAGLEARGEAVAGLDAQAMGAVAFHALNGLFMDFVKDDEMALEALMDEVRTQLGPLARLMASGAGRDGAGRDGPGRDGAEA